MVLREGVDLCVGVFEGDVVESFGAREFTGALDRWRGHIDSKRTSGVGRTSGLASRLTGPTSDVEDAVANLDLYRQAQDLIVPLQFGVVANAAG
jgi:hypothetical protein